MKLSVQHKVNYMLEKGPSLQIWENIAAQTGKVKMWLRPSGVTSVKIKVKKY